MSTFQEPLRPAEARVLLRAILATGEVIFTNHASDEMAQDGISQAEAIGVLGAGWWSLPSSNAARGVTACGRAALTWWRAFGPRRPPWS